MIMNHKDDSDKAEGLGNRVLIIDDEIGPRESLRILLKKEFDVRCADGVDKGMLQLKLFGPDLVVMDIRMPGKTGIEGLREIRAVDPHVSVVMLTGYGELDTAQQAIRLGATDYLNKPFETDQMLEVARRYVHRTAVERRRAQMLQDLSEVNSQLQDEIQNKEHMASIGQSSAEFAHDLRNPLMIVAGYVDLLSQQVEQAGNMVGGEMSQVTDYLGVIETNVRRCCELSQMWQKLAKGGLTGMAELPASQVMSDLLMGVQPLVSSAGVRLTHHVEDEGAVIKGNRAQLLRAMHNIVSNAVDACEPGSGMVHLVGDLQGESLRIVVEDNGCGMDADVRNRMFEPYFSTKDENQGTGLGSCIAHKVIEEHGGSIAVESEPGEGTTVTLLLPLVRTESPVLAEAVSC